MPKPIKTASQLSDILRLRRKAIQLKQADVADRLKLSQERVSVLERNPGRMTVEQLLDFARVLDLVVTISVPAAKAPDHLADDH